MVLYVICFTFFFFFLNLTVSSRFWAPLQKYLTNPQPIRLGKKNTKQILITDGFMCPYSKRIFDALIKRSFFSLATQFFFLDIFF